MQSTLTLSTGIYRDIADKTEGQRASVLEHELQERANTLRALQTETRDQMADMLTNENDEVIDTDQLGEIADHLEEASEDIGETVGKTNATNEKHEEGVAGQAELNTKGSDSFDAGSIEGEGEKIIDKEFAAGLAEHENFHTKQKTPDASEVTLKDGTVVTAHEFIEAGAIGAQKKVAPGSVDKLSDEYKAIEKNVGSKLPPDRLVELSLKGNMHQFAAEMNTVLAA